MERKGLAITAKISETVCPSGLHGTVGPHDDEDEVGDGPHGHVHEDGDGPHGMERERGVGI